MQIGFDELYQLHEQGGGDFGLAIARQKRGRRFVAREFSSGVASQGEWYAAPHADVGDAPDKYHPLYVAALLTARNDATTPDSLRLPAIAFRTDADTRRSMTLNAMRMTREYSQDGSPRVLRLVEQRLEAGQRDVVHDALVYVMRQILSAREEMQNEKTLRSSALAAYFGLPETAFAPLEPRDNARIVALLRAKSRRAIDVETVLEMQRRILRAALVPMRRAERQHLTLLDRIVCLLKK